MATQIQAILDDKGHDVETIRRDADASRAAALMRDQNIAALVVVEDGRVTGLVGERDIVHAVAAGGGSVHGLTVRDVMQTRPETCSPRDTVQKVMETMTQKRHRHIPVVDDDGRLFGIVSIGDMVKFRLGQMELETRVLRDAYVSRH